MEYRDGPVLSFRPIDAKESKPKNVRRLIRFHALIALFCATAVVTLSLLSFLIRPIRVKSDAMSPKYKSGSVVFVTPAWGGPERGDVVAFTDPNGKTGTVYVRRVVALGGQSVEIRRGSLLVDETEADEPYLDPDAAFSKTDLAETKVPEGSVFVIGDNRSETNAVGMIDVRSILGVVRFSVGN